jgi:hypothetical protein
MSTRFTFSASGGSGPQRSVTVRVGTRNVEVPVDDDLFAYFRSQFLRQAPSPGFKARHATVMKLMVAAYKKGASDGKSLP